MCFECLIHGHKYVLFKEMPTFENDYDLRPVEYTYVWQCTKCGKIKKKTIR